MRNNDFGQTHLIEEQSSYKVHLLKLMTSNQIKQGTRTFNTEEVFKILVARNPHKFRDGEIRNEVKSASLFKIDVINCQHEISCHQFIE